MLILVTYDVNTSSEGGVKRLSKVAKVCTNYGVRAQNSVFECVVDCVQLAKLKSELENIIDKNLDSLRYYNLGNNGRNKVDHVGAKASIDVESVLII